MTDPVFFPDDRAALARLLEQVDLRTSVSLERRWHTVQQRRAAGQPADQAEQRFCAEFDLAAKALAHKRELAPSVRYADDLPISAKKDDIAALLRDHQVLVLAGETGSGKTTQLPKICLELGRGLRGKIGHTQPRRIAASSVAQRIAAELQTELGGVVGYQVRFSDQSAPQSYIKVMTDGILLAEIQHDPLLLQYDTLIIDEAHERSLNIDFLLGYLQRILPKRPELKLVITSATIDLERFAKHFNNAPILEVSGRNYPVEIRYRPPAASDEELAQQVLGALEEILAEPVRGAADVLVFLSGEREIREVAQALRKADFKHLDVLPLYARLSMAEQARVFSSHRGRRVVLATNVAETSITVPGIGFVIDPGTARLSRYSARTKVQRLPIEAISQASANQRAGRCGRISPGLCIRLYAQDDFNQRPCYTDPEILRTNLASVVLQMLNLGVGDIRRFPFVDPPDLRLIKDGYTVLEELQAVTGKGQLTPLGKQLAALPLDPRLARMLLAAAALGALTEVLIIASALAIQDPRERPQEKQQAADLLHRRFWHERSDFLAWVNLWQYVETQRQEFSQNQWRKQAAKEFLNYLRLREWRELHHQMRLACKQLKLKENPEPASYEAVHKALLAGLLGNLAQKSEEKADYDYLGTRNRKLAVFPASSQFKKRPKWIVAAEVIETSKVFAHTVAAVEPEWALETGKHLLKHHYYEPHYSAKTGQVMGFDRATLLGLTLADKLPVNYTHIDRAVAREVFLRQALVEGGYAKARPRPGAFFATNQQRIAEVEELEAKSRRRDILVNDEVVYRFYEERVPADVTGLASFEQWRKQAEAAEPQLLHLPKSLLMQHDAEAITEAQFPNVLKVDGLELPLSYHFEPGHPDDGVSVGIPIDVLHSFPQARLDWLVPGLLREKCIALLKALPKTWRKRFVPVPDYVDRALARMAPCNKPLTEVLGEQLQRLLGQAMPTDLWADVVLDDYYRCNIHVLDENHQLIARGRDLSELRLQYKARVQRSIRSASDGIEREQLTGWDFAELPREVALKRGPVTVKAFPALVEQQGNVALRVLDNPLDAQHLSERGVVGLLAKKFHTTVKYLQKELLKNKDLGLSMVSIGSRTDVTQDMIFAAIKYCCLRERELPRTAAEFAQACGAHGELVTTAYAYERMLLEALAQVIDVRKQMKASKNALMLALTFGDIQRQLEHLFQPGFLYATPWPWLGHYGRYLKAIAVRLEKAPQNIQKDRLGLNTVAACWQLHVERLAKAGPSAYAVNPKWQEYRWLIEELRVSLFAQALGTTVPISEKRLRKLWQESFAS